MSDLRPMKAMDYLRSLEPEIIARAYPEGKYSGREDEKAAVELMLYARLAGIAVEIPSASLGRHRSTIGLVAHRSPRGKVPASPALPEVFTGEPEAQQLDLPTATLEERKVAALESATLAFWAMRDVLVKQATLLQIISTHYLPFAGTAEYSGPEPNSLPVDVHSAAWPRE